MMAEPIRQRNNLPLAGTEPTLAGIWTELLDHTVTDRECRFTNLGGHSLMVVRLIARIYECFSVTLSMSEVFRNDSLGEIAKLIDSRITVDQSQEQRNIPTIDKTGPLELSPTQEHLLIEVLRNYSEPLYNEVATIHFHESIDYEVLEKAFNAVIGRHDIFRTSFAWESGVLSQTVHPTATVVISIQDFSTIPSKERENHAENHANQWSSIPFDLSKPPLIRAFLGVFSQEDTRLFIVAHHLAIDAYTLFTIVVRDLWGYYSAIKNDQIASLPHLSLQYPDYAVWKKRAVQRMNSVPLDYWRNNLKDAKALELPATAQSIKSTGRGGLRKVFYLSPDLSRNVKSMAHEAKSSPFVVLLTAFKILMQRLTGENDVSLGSVTSDRDHPSTKDVAGCFLNFITLRTLISAESPFQELVGAVGETVHNAISHQDVPLSVVNDTLRRSGDLQRHPLYKIMFLMEPPQETLPGGWTVDQLSFHPGASKLDLTFEMDERGGQFFGRIEFNSNLYSNDFIDQLISYYERILQQAIRNPAMPVKQYNLISEIDSERVLQTFNNSKSSIAPNLRLHDFMEQAAIKRPDDIALEFGDRIMSYGELKRSSDNVAWMLAKEGVQPNDVVAVVARRSIWLPVALFGVLKSGAAYLPVDPDQPADRVQYLLKDSQTRIALVDENVALESDHSVIRIEIRKAAETQCNEVIQDSAKPEDLAYVLYTSGSTGKPKGAMIEHRSIVNRLLWMVHEYDFCSNDIQIQKTPITFDVSLHELFLWSFVGGRLVIPPPGAERDPAELIRIVQKHRVTQIHFVPSMLDVFLSFLGAFGNEQLLFTLKNVHCSGEALPPSTVESFQRVIGKPLGVGLHNLYGPTEAAVDVSYYDCSNFTGGVSIPIGKPVWNTQLYVLDSEFRPVPIGSSGELYIGGIQVGRGYLNRPDLTQAAFVSDPFSDIPEARLYRTGDLARWLPDGNIEYLGRNDFQIKIRGVRIEPAEIETAIREYPGVTAATCIARKRPDGEVQLLGYYTSSNQSGNSSEAALHAHLRERLPSQMVPSSLIRLDSFPLNASGKLDRSKLPEAKVEQKSNTCPRTPEEVALAEVWATVLKIKDIGREADFFELGGDSIQAIQIISRIREKGYVLNLRHIFDCPSLSEIAAEMKPVGPVSKNVATFKGSAPLIPIQNWFFGLNLKYHSHWNQSRLINFTQAFDISMLESALNKVINNHDSLRLRIRETENGWIQELNPNTQPLELKSIQLNDSNNAKAELELQRFCSGIQASLDVSKGEIIRCAYITQADTNSGELFICIHHLVVDGLSWQIILEELELACTQLLEGREVNLPIEGTSFLEWPDYLKHYSRKIASDEYLVKIRNQITTQGNLIAIEKSTEANLASSTKELKVSLENDETDQLLRKVPSRYKTEINDILLTALALLMESLGCRDSATIFLEGHGREPIADSADLSRTTGWFTTLFPVSLPIRFNETSTAIKSVKELLRSIPGKGLDYGLLTSFNSPLNGIRSVRPEILFNYLGNLDHHISDMALIKEAQPLWTSEFSPYDERVCTHEILAWIESGRLTIAWYYSENLHTEVNIRRILDKYLEHLREIINHCLNENTGGYTPSDFKSSGLSQDALDELYSDFQDIN